jgi:hypothetical protein
MLAHVYPMVQLELSPVISRKLSSLPFIHS